jgi:hypothetical protein
MLSNRLNRVCQYFWELSSSNEVRGSEVKAIQAGSIELIRDVIKANDQMQKKRFR